MTKYRLQSFLFVFVAFMLGCNEYMIVGVLPDIAGEFHVSLASLGYAVTLFALVYAIFTPIITTLASRFNRYHVLLVLMLVFLIGNTWTALASGFWSLMASRVMTATVAGAIISLVLVMANFIAPREKRAGLVSWVFAGVSIASVIGVPIGTSISTTFSWHDSFWMVTWLTLIIFVMLVWLAPKDTPQVKGSFATQFSLFKDVRVLLGVSFIVLVCAADYTFYTYIRPLLTNLMGFSTFWLNWLLFLFGLFFMFGNKFGGYLADHRGIQSLPKLYLLMSVCLAMLAPTFNFPWVGVGLLSFVCVMLASYGASTQLMFLDIAEKDYPQALDLASSLNSIFANIGISLGSFSASLTVNYLSLGSVGYVAAVYGLITTLIVWLLSRRYRNTYPY
ncbi:MAG: MFS transporter [Ligilactobacillus agilis]|nr:MFS transporter [Ligilactobacillus agilis]